MSAVTWKSKLIGKWPSPLLSTPKHSMLPVSEIDRDLPRTFPKESWFVSHRGRIRNVLLWHAWTNRALSYAQPFSFIAFTLYHVFHENNKETSMVTTYYALHRLVSVVRPLYPQDDKDGRPIKFMQTVHCLVRINLLERDPILNARVTPDQMNYVILSGMPTFFTNWFNLPDGVLVLDYVIDESKEIMFSRLIDFIIALFITYRPIFIHLDEWDVLSLIASMKIFSAKTIIARAKRL
jgi:hypothetical protein